ncbi:MAG TPA: PQQ-binding-like beta-propeller repeat protein [Solirubrobacteraceae bacterium]|jgi:outer membrane protein assembly factor BamB|nr:PQQ-binding-like beta-propeller repeat protein [Solirubrobacteraceae bacterium]
MVVVVALLAVSTAPARADWTTYHANAQRTGVDQSSGTSPVPFASTWSSQNLGGKIYAEPLLYHGLVILATEANDVYALSEATGQVVWHANAGTPVPSNQLPCGDISPSVGITSTPVIDPATGTLFVVADTWDGSNAHHVLVAYNAISGAQLSTKNVDPAGSTPENQLQRAGLNLSGGRVLIGFGGNDGDCATYWGWLVSVAEDGSSMTAWQAAPMGHGAAIWATAGPTVDGAGAVYAVTGNEFQTGSTYDYSDAVVKFASPANPVPSSYFAPSDWVGLNTNDLDLGSSGTVLLPGNLAFQDGKDSNGYLLSTANLGGIGGQRYEASTGCASFGGDAYANGVIYVACASGGTLALSVNASQPSFSPLWRGPSDANGSPILAGGLVWVTSYTNGVLYGLNPQTGAVVVRQSTPAMEHFTSPSASDGQLVLATGSTVEAYRIAAAVTVGPTLTVTRAGSGSGTVQGPAIACPGTCSASYPTGTKVTLTATPAAGSGFGGWSGGGCAGIATACTVTMSATTAVTATFKRIGRPTVSGSLSGVGKHRPRLRLTARAGRGAAALSGLAVALPAGLRLERRGLARGVIVTARSGRHLRFIARLRQGLLVIALHTPQRSVTVLLHGHALAATKRLARAVLHARRRPRLKITVTVLDGSGKPSQVILKLRA